MTSRLAKHKSFGQAYMYIYIYICIPQLEFPHKLHFKRLPLWRLRGSRRSLRREPPQRRSLGSWWRQARSRWASSPCGCHLSHLAAMASPSCGLHV